MDSRSSSNLTRLNIDDHLMSSPHPWSVVIAIACKRGGARDETRMEGAQAKEKGRSRVSGREWCGRMERWKERETGEKGDTSLAIGFEFRLCLSDDGGKLPTWMDALTVHVVSVDFLGACTFVTFRDDLTPPGFVLLLADVLVKQTIWGGEKGFVSHTQAENNHNWIDLLSRQIRYLSLLCRWAPRRRQNLPGVLAGRADEWASDVPELSESSSVATRRPLCSYAVGSVWGKGGWLPVLCTVARIQIYPNALKDNHSAATQTSGEF